MEKFQIFLFILCLVALYVIVIFFKKIIYQKTVILDLSFSEEKESSDKHTKYIQYRGVPLEIILTCLNEIPHKEEFEDIECNVFRAYDSVHNKVTNIAIRFSVKSSEKNIENKKALLVSFATSWTSAFRKTILGKICPISIGTPQNLSVDIDITPISV